MKLTLTQDEVTQAVVLFLKTQYGMATDSVDLFADEDGVQAAVDYTPTKAPTATRTKRKPATKTEAPKEDKSADVMADVPATDQEVQEAAQADVGLAVLDTMQAEELTAPPRSGALFP